MRNLEQLYLSNLQSIINSDISGGLQRANDHIKFYIFTFTCKVKRFTFNTKSKSQKLMNSVNVTYNRQNEDGNIYLKLSRSKFL